MLLVISLIWHLLAFCAILLLITAVHEAGHLIACQLVGLRWYVWRIGPLQYSRDTKPHFSIAERWDGGLVWHALPESNITRGRYAVVILGGCAANFLLTIILLTIILHEPLRVQDQDGWLPAIAGFSLMVAIMNLFPLKSRGLTIDGRQLWETCRSARVYREQQERWAEYECKQARYLAVRSLASQYKGAERPRTWDTHLVAQAIQIHDETLDELLAHYYRYLWAIDTGDIEASGESLERAFALRHTVTDFQNALFIEKACWEAVQNHDAPAAQELLTHVSARYHVSASWYRAQAALCWAQGQQAEVRALAQRAREAIAAKDYAEQYLLEYTDRVIAQEKQNQTL